MRLYELSAELAALVDALDAGEDVRERLDAIEQALDRKVEAVVRVLRGLEAERDALGAEISRLETRRLSRERAADRLRDYLRDCLQLAGVGRVRTPIATVSVVPGRERLVVDDERAVPDEWCRVRREVDRARVLSAYREHGECVPGTRVERGEPSLRIA